MLSISSLILLSDCIKPQPPITFIKSCFAYKLPLIPYHIRLSHTKNVSFLFSLFHASRVKWNKSIIWHNIVDNLSYLASSHKILSNPLKIRLLSICMISFDVARFTLIPSLFLALYVIYWLTFLLLFFHHCFYTRQWIKWIKEMTLKCHECDTPTYYINCSSFIVCLKVGEFSWNEISFLLLIQRAFMQWLVICSWFGCEFAWMD